MKVLIADDEKIIRHGMVNTIPWAKIGIDEIYEAHNGLEALTIFKQKRPDILITDIRMPMMDGIALTNEVRKFSADVQIIYLTGYQDINYIKAAFENAAMDYILKPVEYAELLRVIEKAVRLCSEGAGLKKLRFHMEQKLLQSQPFYIRRLLSNLVKGHYPDAAEMEQKLRFWNIQLDIQASYQLLIVTLSAYGSIPIHEREIVCFGVEQILQELIDGAGGGYAVQLPDENKFICILPYAGDEREGQEHLLKRIQSTLEEYGAGGATIAVGPPVEGLFNLNESYAFALMLLIRRFYEGKDGVYFYEQNAVEQETDFHIETSALDDLLEKLRAYDEARCVEEIEKLLSTPGSSRYLSKEHLRGAFLFIASYLLSSVSNGILSRESIDLITHCAEELYQLDNIESVRGVMAMLTRGLKQALQRRTQDPSLRVVEEIKAIVGARFAEGVTINELSKQVFLTPQYLCAVFKQQTGMTINDYVTEQRIAKARKMLLSRQYKLYEIAPAVGYKDVKYFSKIFKRHTGMTPSDYAEA